MNQSKFQSKFQLRLVWLFLAIYAILYVYDYVFNFDSDGYLVPIAKIRNLISVYTITIELLPILQHTF